MDPLANAARFFAFTYYLNSAKKAQRSPKKAGQFARGNWKLFMPYVQNAKFLITPERFNQRQIGEFKL